MQMRDETKEMLQKDGSATFPTPDVEANLSRDEFFRTTMQQKEFYNKSIRCYSMHFFDNDRIFEK